MYTDVILLPLVTTYGSQQDSVLFLLFTFTAYSTTYAAADNMGHSESYEIGSQKQARLVFKTK